ncbi:terminase [Rhodovibrio sodomensis]|uniref:Terminase n=1 Tax=Rhodovibrio sodomensis TaxID=1088 RepID=A0ABS1DG06_9PROT|nr:terminase family protein [Rhodovibrio sodomensis]MBK1668330.1 terminase [Rhodovibrio sodomensis]
MLAADLARALDPVTFARDAGITPDPWQADVLTSTSHKALLLCCRQSGKSTTTALCALHEATYSPRALILLLSPSQRQSSELFRKVMAFYSAIPGAPEIYQESAMRAEFVNGSRIIALPGSGQTVRGYSGASLVVIDEAAQVDDELLAAVRPMLATTRGRLIALSTPYGKRGWFYEAWRGAGDWQRICVTADDCPRISQEFLDEERAELGEWSFRQEYLCEFVDTEEQFFATDVIEAALSDEVQPLW